VTSVAVIIVAAGSGTRLGAAQPKAFVSLGDATVLEHAVARAVAATSAPRLVIVVPAGRVDSTTALLSARLPGAADRVTVVPGGAERADSVLAGLAAVDDSVDVVLVHDAARALTPSSLFDEVARAVADRHAGVLPVVPIADTVKRVGADRVVTETVDRSVLAAAQTPQGFPRVDLVEAYRMAAASGALASCTDDAAVFAAADRTVSTIDGSPLAFKITTPADLERAEAILEGGSGRGAAITAPAGELRTGIGVDAHAFKEGTPLWLGGILWPDAEAGLAGHSDGDAAAHAIVDALLTAAGLGDIGSRFGTADPQYAGASGARFIAEAVALVEDAGWRVVNASVEIITNAPKLGPRRHEMQDALSAALGAPVSVAATTSDGLGMTGEGRGIAAVASALLVRAS